MNISTYVNEGRMRRSIARDILRDIAGITNVALKLLHALIGSLQNAEKLYGKKMPDSEISFALEKLEEIDDLLYRIRLDTR